MIKHSLRRRYALRSIFDVDALVSKYISKTTPESLPLVGKFYAAYMGALLKSSLITGALDTLHAISGADSDPDVESLNFLLKDFCSSVGVNYEARYREAILRSLVRKDEEFFRWFGDQYLGGVRVLRLRAGLFGDKEGIETTDMEIEDEIATTDMGLFTDMYIRAPTTIVFDFESQGMTKDKAIQMIEKVIDLLLLVSPARLPVLFRFVPDEEVGSIDIDGGGPSASDSWYERDFDNLSADSEVSSYDVLIDEEVL